MYLPKRYLICALIFAGMFLKNALRANLSVAVVVMTASHPVTLDNGTTIQVKEFDWSSKEKGYILGSYFYGYFISEFPSGWLSGRFGGRNILGLGILFASLCSFLIPSVAVFGAYPIFVCRALIGIFEGGCWSSIIQIWSQWAPEREKTTLIAISIIGANLSNVVCFFLYGILATVYGWRALFYVPGGITLIWCLIWFACVKSRPEDDKTISPSELEYIQSSERVKPQGKLIYPWKSILTSNKVWSLIFGRFCDGWTYFFLTTELPSYFKDVWKMEVKHSGLFLMITFSAGFIVSIVCSILVDYLIVGRKYSITLIRKLFYAIGGVGAAVSLSLAGSAISATMAVVFVTLITSFTALFHVSIVPSPVDIAPQFSSLIMGMMTTGSSLASMIAPTLTGYITTHQSKDEWFVPFAIASGLNIAGVVIYSVFGSNEVQPWAMTDLKDDDQIRRRGSIQG